jgi:hypothetical protein
MKIVTTELLPSRTAAVVAAVGLLAIAAFQVALALGAPRRPRGLGAGPTRSCR